MLKHGSDGRVFLTVRVKPGAKSTKIVEIDENCLHLQIAAPPRDGECNEALIKYISKILGIKKTGISLVLGHKSRDKTLSIVGNYADILDKINRLKQN
ncbi:UPF0235 protein Daro_3887 [Babesia microti strain RI]|uniref:UPF0235 protein Daro_3887 n=1 Tax=Babesia microti (strain RI) TaxID=1133968 RepID=A0A0K3AU35_BABMR|nr:UPF0235 protein Daro_3887 [Babesia microti strain RI]CTQ41096.1 UPF0235 protein Daro_3887 [Babesia microti strain RI]|eukprot:XP_012649107.1 UPF0235 protein Daro_3887 [Babesia microti strain RI]